MSLLNRILKRNPNQDSSLSIDDQAVIKSFTDDPAFPYLVSFPRTGSHWLRMVMELYFEKPSLVRVFYYMDASNFTCYHTHDMDLKLQRNNVIYLFRNPVDTIYSQLCYCKEDPDDRAKRNACTSLYAQHLAKWLVREEFSQKKTIVTYEAMKADMAGEFGKIGQHFGVELDRQRLESILAMVSKANLKRKTRHDEQVVNLTTEYQDGKQSFSGKYKDEIYSQMYSGEPQLLGWLPMPT